MEKEGFTRRLENRVFDMDIPAAVVTNACYEAMVHHFLSVQIFPVMIEECRKVLENSEVKIAVLIDYPHGGFPPELKAFEIEDAKKRGAEIFNVCITNRNVKDQKWSQVDQELQILRRAAGKAELRIFLETEYLTTQEIKELCNHAAENRIDTVITSTGLYYKLDKEMQTEVPVKADLTEIRLLKESIKGRMKIMAQGFIDDAKFAQQVLEAGADYIGSVNALKILEEF